MNTNKEILLITAGIAALLFTALTLMYQDGVNRKSERIALEKSQNNGYYSDYKCGCMVNDTTNEIYYNHK
jgi:hypothetical protein